MKTPIQELKEYIFNTFELGAYQAWIKQTIAFLNKTEEKEKEFARLCFEAGEAYRLGEHECFKQTHKPFGEWYKQFEQ